MFNLEGKVEDNETSQVCLSTGQDLLSIIFLHELDSFSYSHWSFQVQPQTAVSGH